MSRTLRRTGLRDVALVTVNDTDPRVTAAGGNGTGYLTMMFRVNGAPVYVTNSRKSHRVSFILTLDSSAFPLLS